MSKKLIITIDLEKLRENPAGHGKYDPHRGVAAILTQLATLSLTRLDGIRRGEIQNGADHVVGAVEYISE
jgi:hypothetical protein